MNGINVMENRYMCPVCGYLLEEPPDNFNICECCGTEFGYHDAGHTHSQLTLKWMQKGAPWHSQRFGPYYEGWNAIKQLLNAGIISIKGEGRTVYTCPVCGYDEMEYPPRDCNICPCCACEFEISDYSWSHEELRLDWIKRGAKWWSEYTPAPIGWNARDQINKAGFALSEDEKKYLLG